jgi:hypothetical protein
MSFYGSSFTYNGVPSEVYDLRILNFNASSPSDSPAGSDVNIVEKWVYRQDHPYYFGRIYQTPLEFDFTVGSFNSIPADMRSAAESWLVGQMSYQPLQIIQDDMANTVFNVIFTKASTTYIGNVNFALNLHARCDRPWGLYYPPRIVKNYIVEPMIDQFIYNNQSDNPDYNKPQIVFTMNNSGGDFTITNYSDNSRQFIFTGLYPNEIMTIDNDLEIISSNLGYLRMGHFNKKFFRMVQGVNDLIIKGSISKFIMSPVWAKKVGG